MITPLPFAQRPTEFVASSKRDLTAMPDAIKAAFGFAIYMAQIGEKHPDARPLKGFGGAGVLEVVESLYGNTYRAVYTLKFQGVVYVLDAFQKKSKKGSKTPKLDMDRIHSRFKIAEKHYQENYQKQANIA